MQNGDTLSITTRLRKSIEYLIKYKLYQIEKKCQFIFIIYYNSKNEKTPKKLL